MVDISDGIQFRRDEVDPSQYYDVDGSPGAINYQKISMYLLEIIKKHEQKIEEYEQRINELERRTE